MKLRIAFVLLAASLLAWLVGGAQATGWRKTNNDLAYLNKNLRGQVIDQTANHGKDNRIWSRTLGQRRDLYVYLPPGFDTHERYPLMLLFHGIGEDEQSMLKMIPYFDKAIAAGELAPFIIAMPDGSFNGDPDYHQPATFFINSNLGDFEDYVLQDVWDFLFSHYPLRQERCAHILAGTSMGGFAAYSMGIRHRYCFGTVIGMMPPLNLRWMDDCCNYFAKFDPHHWGWRTAFDRPHEVLGRFYAGLGHVNVKQLIEPLFDSPDQAIAEVSRLNPIELVDRTCLRNGELNMYVGYGAEDEFNIDAQVESFLYVCKWRRLYVGVGYDPKGRHEAKTVYRLTPGMICWLAPRLAMYQPAADCPDAQVCARPYIARKEPLPAAKRPANQPFVAQPSVPNPPPSASAGAAPPPAAKQFKANRPEPAADELVGPPPEALMPSPEGGQPESTPPPPSTASAPPRPTTLGPAPTGRDAVVPRPSRADLGPVGGPPVAPGP